MMMTAKNILLIEDNTTLATGLQACLASQGFQVLHVINGQQALDACQEGLPDLIVTDVLMQTMDGVTFLQNLRQLSGGWEVPVIVISGVAQQGAFDEMKALGVKRFVIKPFSLDVFLHIVGETIHEAGGT